MKIICFSYLLLFFTCGKVNATLKDTTRIASALTTIPLVNKAYYIKTNSTVSVDSAKKLFIDYSKGVRLSKINLGYSPDIIWLGIPIKSISEETDWLLEIRNPQIDYVQGYCVSSNIILPLGNKTGDELPFLTRTIHFRNYLWQLNQCGKGNFWVILRLEKRNSSMSVPAYLWKPNAYYQHETKLTLFFGICFGMMLLAAVYSLLGSFFYRSIIYIYYFLFILSVILLLGAGEGINFQFLYPSIGGFNSLFRVSIIGIATGLLTLFSKEFLSISTYSKLINKILNINVGLFVIILLGLPFLHEFYLQNSAYMVPIILLIAIVAGSLCILSAIISYPHQKEISMFYLVAYSATLIGSLLSSMEDLGWIEKLELNPLFICSLIEIVVFSFGLTFRMKKIIDERNLLAIKITRQQKETMKAYVNGIEKERTRIAGELHDDIGSRLANLTRSINVNKGAPEYLEKQIEKLSDDVRKISHQLASPGIELLGLVPLVNQLIYELNENNKVKFDLQYYDIPETLPENMIQQVYRVMQEAFNNILKHANATTVDVQLFFRDEELVVTIEDDGNGFNFSGIHKPGLGLNQMQSRIESINGKFEINSSPSNGTQIMLTVPLG